MVTRLVFLSIAVGIGATFMWTYHHDARLENRVSLVTIGDPNEAVRDLLGEPTSEGSCGRVSPSPSGCTDEYLYRYYFNLFQPQYEVLWFNAEGKVIGEQHVRRPF
jgi:hypothetical protein